MPEPRRRQAAKSASSSVSSSTAALLRTRVLSTAQRNFARGAGRNFLHPHHSRDARTGFRNAWDEASPSPSRSPAANWFRGEGEVPHPIPQKAVVNLVRICKCPEINFCEAAQPRRESTRHHSCRCDENLCDRSPSHDVSLRATTTRVRAATTTWVRAPPTEVPALPTREHEKARRARIARWVAISLRRPVDESSGKTTTRLSRAVRLLLQPHIAPASCSVCRLFTYVCAKLWSAAGHAKHCC